MVKGTLELKVSRLPDSDKHLALTNHVYVNGADYEVLAAAADAAVSPAKEKYYVSIKNNIYTFRRAESTPQGCIALSAVQRTNVMVSLNEPISVSVHIPEGDNIWLGAMRLEIDFVTKGKKAEEKYEGEDVKKYLLSQLDQQMFVVGQKFILEYHGNNISFKVLELHSMQINNTNNNVEAKMSKTNAGVLFVQSEVTFEKAAGSFIMIAGNSSAANASIFKPDWKFESMGIGGLDKEFADMMRTAFASRIFPQAIVQKLGIQHVKGMLLYGPPGTGKTLMARQIGKMLNGKEPKVVNGPEVFSKFVGQTEENVRNLFKDAEEEYKRKGEDSDLHIIIFDEFDAIARARGSRNDSTGVADTVVNQLLSKIDGVESLNNILLIGMTNRKELIDEALLRPGRLEVHLEISLPDEFGRQQIFRIHTTKMRENKFMADDVSLEELAALSKNYSGAEIEGVVRRATSYAFSRQLDIKNLSKKIEQKDIMVTRADFMQAMGEVIPTFGMEKDEFENCVRNGIINYSTSVERILTNGKLFASQVTNSDRTPLVSVLLSGQSGSGKTALAATIAKMANFPFTRLLSPDSLVGYSEATKCAKITKVFEDSYRSPVSVIVVDDIERILEYVPIGSRFSNAILQTLLVLLKRPPPKGRKLLVIGTTSNKDVLAGMEFMECFNTTLYVPVIDGFSQLKRALTDLKVFPESEIEEAALKVTSAGGKFEITIKKLIMLTELAKQGSDTGRLERFFDIISDYCGVIPSSSESVL